MVMIKKFLLKQLFERKFSMSMEHSSTYLHETNDIELLVSLSRDSESCGDVIVLNNDFLPLFEVHRLYKTSSATFGRLTILYRSKPKQGRFET